MGISESIRKIQEAMDNNKLIVFIGAGVSANSKLPKWLDLIKEFAKGLNIDIDREFSTDEYLKIPQYYYNQRGFKEYYDVINKIFDVNAEPNLIHDYILKMNPQHIITTNYDDLIEQAIENHLLFYDIVSEDNDLPYTPNGRLFIKMHGDLKKRNIVLKEDDYLNYSEKFRLIETFIKALFINHTVLFIGYSLQDYDLKVILRNINNILGENFQKAYIIDVNDNNSRFYNGYFGNLGVNIININNIGIEYRSMKVDEIENQYGKDIVRILQCILDTQDEYSEIIEFYYNKLKYIKDMLSVRVKDIAKILNIYGQFRYQNGKLDVYNVEENSALHNLVKVLLEYKKQDSEESQRKYKYIKYKYEIITKIFLRAKIQEIIIHFIKNERKILNVKFDLMFKETNLQIISNIEIGNFAYIDSIASKNYKKLNIHSNKYFNEIIKSYCNYVVGKYVTAYTILKNTSNKTYRDKDYVAYFICEYNKEQLVRIIKNVGIPLFGVPIGETVFLEQIKDIIDDYNKADSNIKEIYFLLPKKERKNISFLEDLILNETYISSKVSRIKELRAKVEEEVVSKFMCSDPCEFSIREIKDEVKEFWDYTHNNFLMLDHYSEVITYYYNYIMALFSTYSKKKEEILDKDDIFKPKEFVKLMPEYKFNIFDVSIICTYVTAEQLNEAFSEYSIDNINLNKSDPQNLPMICELLNSLITSFSQLKFKSMIYKKISALLVFLSRAKDIGGALSELMLKITKLIDNEVDNSIYNSVATFIYYQSLKEIIFDDSIMTLISKFIIKLLNKTKLYDNKRDYEIEALNSNYIEILVNCIKNIENCKIKNTNELNELFNEIQFGIYKTYKYFILEKVFIPLRKIIDKDFTNMICKFIESDYENLPSRLYLMMNVNGMLNPNEQAENIIFSRIDKEIKMRENQKFTKIPDPLEDEMMIIGNLYYLKKLLNCEKALNYKGHFDIYDLIVDKENFDYKNKFKVQWINTLSDNFLSDISKISRVKAEIKEMLSKEIINKQCDKNIKKAFFCYFD